MKTIIFLIILFLPLASFGQYDVKFRVHYIAYKGDTLKYEKPKEVNIPIESTTSKIVDLGKYGNRNFGLQIEIFDSKLYGYSRKIACLVFYRLEKNEDIWVEICKTNYTTIELIETSTPVDYGTDQFPAGYGEGTPTNYFIAYDIEYRLKK